VYSFQKRLKAKSTFCALKLLNEHQEAKNFLSTDLLAYNELIKMVFGLSLSLNTGASTITNATN